MDGAFERFAFVGAFGVHHNPVLGLVVALLFDNDEVALGASTIGEEKFTLASALQLDSADAHVLPHLDQDFGVLGEERKEFWVAVDHLRRHPAVDTAVGEYLVDGASVLGVDFFEWDRLDCLATGCVGSGCLHSLLAI